MARISGFQLEDEGSIPFTYSLGGSCSKSNWCIKEIYHSGTLHNKLSRLCTIKRSLKVQILPPG